MGLARPAVPAVAACAAARVCLTARDAIPVPVYFRVLLPATSGAPLPAAPGPVCSAAPGPVRSAAAGLGHRRVLVPG